MKIALILATALFLAMPVTSAIATPPPAHGGYLAGWGMNPGNWTATTGSWNSGFSLYNPNGPGPGGGDNWVVDWLPSIVYGTYDPITFELWVEMYSVQAYHYTSYQWHRLGNNAETITFVIQGTIQSNSGQWISLVWDGTDPLTHLWFRHDIFNRTGAPYGYDLPITWIARWGDGLVYGQNLRWESYVTPNPDIDVLIDEACDHWFEFEGSFDLAYHVDDGYYSLTAAGCPAPEL